MPAHITVARELGSPVIAVDNDSTDGSAALLVELGEREPGLRVVLNESNRGYAAAANQGAAMAPGRDLLLLNPDVGLGSADAVRRLVGFLEATPGAGLVGPRLVYPDGTVQPSARSFPSLLGMAGHGSAVRRFPPVQRAAERYLSLPPSPGPHRVDWVIGAAQLIRREAWDAAGGFDERYFLYLEDVDLCLRSARLGWQTWYLPDVSLTHAYERASRPEGGWWGTSPPRRHHVLSMLRFFVRYPRLALRR